MHTQENNPLKCEADISLRFKVSTVKTELNTGVSSDLKGA